MNQENFFEITGQISDEHIAQAALYKPKEAGIRKKLAISSAACVAVIALCALTGFVLSNKNILRTDIDTSPLSSTYAMIFDDKNTDSPSYPTSGADASDNSSAQKLITNAFTNQENTAIDNNNISGEFDEYSDLIYENNHYIKHNVSHFAANEYKKLGAGKLECSNQNSNEQISADTEVFEISGINTELAVAVKNESASLYFIFVNRDFAASDLGDFLNKSGIDLNKLPINGCNNYNYFKKLNDGEISHSRRSTGVATYENILSFFENNRRAVCTKNKTAFNNEKICGTLTYLGSSETFTISDNGYLYIDCGSETFAFEIGEENCKNFIDEFLSESCDLQDGTIG